MIFQSIVFRGRHSTLFVRCDYELKLTGIGITDSSHVNDLPATSGSAAGFTMQNVGSGGKIVPDVPAPNEAFIPGRVSLFNASMGPGDSARKLLTMRRNLLSRMKELITSPDRKRNDNFDINAMQCEFIQELHDKFCEGVDN